MANTRPLPPADINPWGKTIERDVDNLITQQGRISGDAATALQTANAAIAGLTSAVQTFDWNAAIQPGTAYWGDGAANQPPGGGWWTGNTVLLPRTSGPTIIRQILTQPDVNAGFVSRISSDGGSTWGAWSAAIDDTGWVNVSSYATGYSAQPGFQPRFRIKTGILYGDGLIAVGGGASTVDNSVICTIPISVNFAVKRHLLAATNNTAGAIGLLNGNVVRSGTTAYTSWLSMSAIVQPID